MVPLPDALVFSSTPAGNFPSELDSLVDFVADDDRPTFVLDHATTAVLYCNNAFEALNAAIPQSSSSPSWFTSLLEAACDGARPRPRLTETLATFAERSWTRKSIGSFWIAVSCLGHVDNTPGVRSLAESIPDLPATRQGFGPALPVETNPLKRQESDTGSIASASTNSWSIASSDMDLWST
jgi:hypothetical protein